MSINGAPILKESKDWHEWYNRILEFAKDNNAADYFDIDKYELQQPSLVTCPCVNDYRQGATSFSQLSPMQQARFREDDFIWSSINLDTTKTLRGITAVNQLIRSTVDPSVLEMLRDDGRFHGYKLMKSLHAIKAPGINPPYNIDLHNKYKALSAGPQDENIFQYLEKYKSVLQAYKAQDFEDRLLDLEGSRPFFDFFKAVESYNPETVAIFRLEVIRRGKNVDDLDIYRYLHEFEIVMRHIYVNRIRR